MIEQFSRVARDPNASRMERIADKANSPIIALLAAENPDYCPYCMRCQGLHRMTKVEPFLWEHSCGAIHDERQVLTAFDGGAES